ncbi:hypothetical protein AA309_05490 [Microvirga vignae]|uniref:Nuclease n=1 Tax=Microvirga vignae TaxID=1225564 RepID=A0A0H1RFG6_9HYPH|nr:hypothetical protein [Microvirga vignae]KLK93935.1 hypothetical protein AA309_05490 [Microvirga vignae]
MTSLWRVDSGRLIPVTKSKLDTERQLEEWIERDPTMLDPDLMIIGRQVETGFGRIDLLGVASDGSLRVIELKRDRTPREVIAQVLDYASWVTKLTTPDVHRLAEEYFRSKNISETFAQRFRSTFDTALPDPLNTTHGLLIVASSLDPSSQRIVEYLSEVHGVAINTAFFNVFSDQDRVYVSADWLLDQQSVIERTETRTKAPWSGIWYGNVGEGPHRSWEDMRRYGFLAAGNGRLYSSKLELLNVGDAIFVYQKRQGYVGYGIISGSVIRARDYTVDGKPLFDLPLLQPNLKHDADDPDLAEYLVPIKWERTYSFEQAKTFPGAFANQNIVCRLRDQATLDFLYDSFGIVR